MSGILLLSIVRHNQSRPIESIECTELLTHQFSTNSKGLFRVQLPTLSNWNSAIRLTDGAHLLDIANYQTGKLILKQTGHCVQEFVNTHTHPIFWQSFALTHRDATKWITWECLNAERTLRALSHTVPPAAVSYAHLGVLRRSQKSTFCTTGQWLEVLRFLKM